MLLATASWVVVWPGSLSPDRSIYFADGLGFSPFSSMPKTTMHAGDESTDSEYQCGKIIGLIAWLIGSSIRGPKLMLFTAQFRRLWSGERPICGRIAELTIERPGRGSGAFQKPSNPDIRRTRKNASEIDPRRIPVTY
jgi:hypothetical protein